MNLDRRLMKSLCIDFVQKSFSPSLLTLAAIHTHRSFGVKRVGRICLLWVSKCSCFTNSFFNTYTQCSTDHFPRRYSHPNMYTLSDFVYCFFLNCLQSHYFTLTFFLWYSPHNRLFHLCTTEKCFSIHSFSFQLILIFCRL